MKHLIKNLPPNAMFLLTNLQNICLTFVLVQAKNDCVLHLIVFTLQKIEMHSLMENKSPLGGIFLLNMHLAIVNVNIVNTVDARVWCINITT